MPRKAIPERRLGRVLAKALTPAFLPALLLFVAACELRMPTPPGAAPAADRLSIAAVKFSDLPGWDAEDYAAALPPFLRSCDGIDKRDAKQSLADDESFGTWGHWQKLCKDARLIRPGNRTEAKYFWETRFIPYSVANGGQETGLFTGYFEPELEGRWAGDPTFRHPIYSRPDDLVAVDLGKHRPEWKGEHIAGRVADNTLVPYYSRAEIDAGALKGRGLEFIWVADPVALFFLHVQGSGRVKLQDGTWVRVGYAGRNGRRYTAIGRELVALGVMPLDKVTAPAIADWLRANPVQGRAVMERNQSYVFFRVLEGDGPIGAFGVPLSAGRSLAVDPAFLPLGVPLWLSVADPLQKDREYRRLMMAQDTGSAIKGPVRGDVFWGFGDEAGRRAGVMKSQGRYFALLPREAVRAAAPN